MPTCQGRYAPPKAVALLPPQARTILKYALFYHGGRHLQKILNIAAVPFCRQGLERQFCLRPEAVRVPLRDTEDDIHYQRYRELQFGTSQGHRP